VLEICVAKLSRQVLLVNLLKTEEEDVPSVLNSVPLGSYKKVQKALEDFNTYPDGSNSPENYGLLFGPGLIVQMPMVGPEDPIMQIAVSMQEEDIAWPVLMRICKKLGWRMMDPQTGRSFGA